MAERRPEEEKGIEERARDLLKDLHIRATELREQVKNLKQKAARTATERPLLALGVAFVIGTAFGIALSRPKKGSSRKTHPQNS